MAFATLDANGNITGLYGNPQPQIASYAEIADDDPRIPTFTAAIASLKIPKPTPRQWLERLTADKQAAIATAGANSSTILLWLLKAAGTPAIDVTAAETVAGVQALVTAGIITAADQTILLET